MEKALLGLRVSFFAQSLMTDLLLREEYEAFESIEEHRNRRLHDLLSIESDLVYYGHFTSSDVNKMKVIERKFHINHIDERFRAMKEARENR